MATATMYSRLMSFKVPRINAFRSEGSEKSRTRYGE